VPHLRLRDVHKAFDGASRPAVHDFALEAERGQVVVLVGPSGCGKSTALRMVAGLADPDRGTIELDGRDLRGVPPQDRDIAMVFQGYALYPHMTVRENVEFPLKMRGVPKAERTRRADRAMETLGLAKLARRLPQELSGGERQRVAMGRAIVREPKLFLFDEPLSNLDAALRTELRVELAKLLRAIGATAIYVTHDQVEAMTLADKLVVMRGGAIEQSGTPREVYEAPETSFVAGFLGAPPINTAELAVREGTVDWGGAKIACPTSHERVLLALRPEALEIVPTSEPGAVAARVVLVESLGPETIVHTELRDDPTHAVRVVCRGFFRGVTSDVVGLRFSHGAARFFDPTSGRCLS
jgi:multiple sugar transport system ATP-binding protein